MITHVQRILALGAVLMGTASAAMAQSMPWQQPGAAIVAPETRAAQDAILTTQPATPAITVTQPGQQATPSPFGLANPAQYEPIPDGPRSVSAVPVENVDAVETSEPAPAIATPPEADPVNEDPAAPTELTAPMFSADAARANLPARVAVLNKVTARAEQVVIQPGETKRVGKLDITVNHCQFSVPSSLPDAAAMLVITEPQPEGAAPKLLFSGWMYQSSPSVSALEHPVYDVTLTGCEGTPPKKGKKPKE